MEYDEYGEPINTDIDIHAIMGLAGELYKQRDHVLDHMPEGEREPIAYELANQCDGVMYLGYTPEAMWEAMNAFTLAMRKAPDSTHYIDAHDLAYALGELFQQHFEVVPENVHGALAILQGQLERVPDPSDPDAILDHVIGLFVAWLNPELHPSTCKLLADELRPDFADHCLNLEQRER